MENSVDYLNHINIVKDLNLYTKEEQNPPDLEFEAVYEKAKDANVKLETAKDFLHDLSEEELDAIYKSSSFLDELDIDSLSDEGAYNLLVHSYEEYDFNNDGLVEVGVAKMIEMVPRDMEDDAKEAWVNTINAMHDDGDMMSIMFMTMSMYLDEHGLRDIAENMNKMTDAQLDEMQEHASYDIRAFINKTLSTPHVPQTISMLDILNKIDDAMNPTNGEYTSPELMQSLGHLKEEFSKAYEKVKNSKVEETSTEQLLENSKIEQNNETLSSGLEDALKG